MYSRRFTRELRSMSVSGGTVLSRAIVPIPLNWVELVVRPRQARFPVRACVLSLSLFVVLWIPFYLDVLGSSYVRSPYLYIVLGVVWIFGVARWGLQKIQLPFQFFSAFIALLVFSLGWFISYTLGLKHYTEAAAVYAGCLVVAWVLGSVYWGSQRLRHLIDDLEPWFSVKDYRSQE